MLFVKLSSTSSQPVPAPFPSRFTVVSEGKTYRYKSVQDSTLVIKGTDRQQLDYAIQKDRRDGYLNPDPNNAVEGYIIYEVPVTFTQGYVQATLNGKTVAWTLRSFPDNFFNVFIHKQSLQSEGITISVTGSRISDSGDSPAIVPGTISCFPLQTGEYSRP